MKAKLHNLHARYGREQKDLNGIVNPSAVQRERLIAVNGAIEALDQLRVK